MAYSIIRDGEIIPLTDAEYEAQFPQVPETSQPVSSGITYKADVWRRASPEQAAAIDTELTKLDVKMRRLWDDAAYIDHNAEEFTLLMQTMVAAFGEEEAARIMAPSDV